MDNVSLIQLFSRQQSIMDVGIHWDYFTLDCSQAKQAFIDFN